MKRSWNYFGLTLSVLETSLFLAVKVFVKVYSKEFYLEISSYFRFQGRFPPVFRVRSISAGSVSKQRLVIKLISRFQCYPLGVK